MPRQRTNSAGSTGPAESPIPEPVEVAPIVLEPIGDPPPPPPDPQPDPPRTKRLVVLSWPSGSYHAGPYTFLPGHPVEVPDEFEVQSPLQEA